METKINIPEVELFSESDDEMAKRLMKDLMPSNYLHIKKRRGELSAIT